MQTSDAQVKPEKEFKGHYCADINGDLEGGKNCGGRRAHRKVIECEDTAELERAPA